MDKNNSSRKSEKRYKNLIALVFKEHFLKAPDKYIKGLEIQGSIFSAKKSLNNGSQNSRHSLLRRH